MSWIINGLAFVGSLSLIAIALLIWAVWRDDDTPPTTTTRHQTDAWQQAIATKQAQDQAAYQAALAMTLRAQQAERAGTENEEGSKSGEEGDA